ncbi:acetate--CoA ligase family protein [Rhodovibrionaceae bacterium A322]
MSSLPVDKARTDLVDEEGAPLFSRQQANLKRLMAPRHIAVIGGNEAAEVVRQCAKNGFSGAIWPVNPRRETLGGLPTFATVQDLPEAPDAVFLAIPREPAIAVVRDLSAMGAGGLVCYASGFAEAGPEGKALQDQLLQAAGDMALIGPNCYGLLNYLDGAALWPDQHGGKRVESGVAMITQSGNIGISLTMQERSLPLAYMIAVGNKAALDLHDYITVLVEDPRVRAIGLHIEGLDDVAGFSRAAELALKKGVPIVAIKAGRSELGAQATLSHTSSLAGSDQLYDAFFDRLGVVRVDTLPQFIETLKLLDVLGPLAGNRVATISCSGGEAALCADLADQAGLLMPQPGAAETAVMEEILGELVTVSNPLDYHTFIWGDLDKQSRCFSAMLSGPYDAVVKVLDFPKPGLCSTDLWDLTLEALIQAQKNTGQKTIVAVTLPENLPLHAREKALESGIAPMQGLGETMAALKAAAWVGQRRQEVQHQDITLPAVTEVTGPIRNYDEVASKALLAAEGLPVPEGALLSKDQVVAQCENFTFPLVLKAVSADLLHKSDQGGVALNLQNSQEVAAALSGMAELSDQFLLESMVPDSQAELIVGIKRDPQFGLALVLGAGGVLVELLEDSKTLLLPCDEATIEKALKGLKISKLLSGYRGEAAADWSALISAAAAVAAFAEKHRDKLLELDVNPLIVRRHGQGVVAVDAVIRMAE